MNAKEELLEILKEIGNISIKCANIIIDDSNSVEVNVILKTNYTEEEYEKFFKKIDIEYDEIIGTVWLNDNAWLERNEYDGSEWWEYKICPTIPSFLIK